MITITRRIEFDAGHRVLGHEGKCKHLHGHRYRAEITVRASKLDNLGRVVDFGVIKELVGGWIDQYWDHNLLLHPDDPLLQYTAATSKGFQSKSYSQVFGGKHPYLVAYGNPTAENMARVLFTAAQSLLEEKGLEVVRVRLYETPNSWADYTPDQTES